MNKSHKLSLNHNIKSIFILFIILIFLFPQKKVFAELKDDYPGADIKDCTWHLTWFGGEKMGSGVTADDCTYNEQNGWYEYNYNGTNYVVLAGAHRKLIGEEDSKETGRGKYRSWIHYFEYYDTIQFKLNGQIYNGIILDACGAAMRVEEGSTQILDVYTSKDETLYDGKMKEYSGAVVEVTDTGSFSSSAGVSSSTIKRNKFMDIIAALFSLIGDVINMILNTTFTLTYTRSDIIAKDQLNDQIEVGEYGDTPNDNIFKVQKISSQVDNQKGLKDTVFSVATEIPVIPVDLYSASTDTIEILDVNFLDTNSSHSNSFWKGIVLSFSRVVLYISGALILTMVIWRSVLLVKYSFGDSPEGAAKSKKIIDNLFKAIMLIVVIYVIIALMTYLYQYVLGIVLNGNVSGYLIRADVENVYSFNTNLVGYFKYMSLQNNSGGCLGYSIVYCIITIISAIWYVFMFLRPIGIGILIIIAPLTAVTVMRERVPTEGMSLTNLLYFSNWLKIFLLCLWLPLTIVIIYRLILYI